MVKHWVALLSAVLGLCVSLSSAPAWAATAVFPAEGTNVEPGEDEVLTQLFADAYSVESGDRVMVVRLDESEAGAVDYSQAAVSVGADEYIVLRIVRLGENLKVRASRHRADGTVVFSAKMGATSMDDLEHVVDRLSTALWKQVDPKETKNLRNITKDEVRQSTPNRTKTERVMGLRSSMTWALASDVEIDPMVSIGFDGRFEGESYFLEIGAGFLFPTNDGQDKRAYGGLYTEFGGSLYLTQTEVSPYVGLGVIPRLIAPSGANLAGYAQLGVMFMRSSSTRLYVDGRIAQNLTPINFTLSGPDTSDGNEGGAVQPTELSVQVGIGW